MVSYHNIKAANESILHGTVIQGNSQRTEKCKKEALCCLKCHCYNHIAKHCTSEKEICSTCATAGHATKDSPNPTKTKCASCNVEGHPAWSRECPTLICCHQELDKQVPENAMPFFPTHKPWTWTESPPSNTDEIHITTKPKNQKGAKEARKAAKGVRSEKERRTGEEVEGKEESMLSNEEELWEKINKAGKKMKKAAPASWADNMYGSQ